MHSTLRKILYLTGSFLVLFTATLSAQNMKTNYTNWWQKIDSLVEKKGLYRSALTEINALYKKAKSEKQEAQQIKALVYRIGLQQELEEFIDTLAIHDLKLEIAANAGTTKAILNTLLADYYIGYYQQHRWELYNSSTTRNYQKESIRTWGAADFHEAIDDAFTEGLKESISLQSSNIEKYDAIVRKGNARKLRPTIYDLLAWKALEYYQQEESEIVRPTETFKLRDTVLFAPASEFINRQFQTSDTNSHHYRAVILYQQLLSFHQNDKNPDAFIDADINRIQFIFNNSSIPGEKRLYASALEKIYSRYKGQPAADQAAFLLASHLTTSTPADHKRAISICEGVIKTKNDSEGYINCNNLLQSIKEPSLSITTENVNIPSQPFRTLVSWKNLDKIYLRLIKVDQAGRIAWLSKNYGNNNDWWSGILKQKAIRNWDQSLPGEIDHNDHRTEIKIDALPLGEYILLAASKPDMQAGDTYLSANYFHISSISYVKRNNEYFILDRNSGHPLPKAAIQTWQSKYDYNSRKYELQKDARYTANDQGFFGIGQHPNKRISLEIDHKGDHLFLLEEGYYYNYSPAEEKDKDSVDYEAKQSRVFFFTDRSIYRPGQTIYFKGIAVTKDRNDQKSKIYSGRATTVYLYNANGEVQDSLSLKTNEYGSYSGRFTLPETGLTGSFRLEDRILKGEAYLQVEEYKRPKFYVEYKPLTGSYRINDSVIISGLAKSYAGNPINNAVITYRVTRMARFPYPWGIMRGPIVRSEIQEIANGNIKTNDDGSFTIPFLAIPDEDIHPKTDPVFDYEVNVDVTDQNGETRSANTTVPVSYKAIQVNITAPQYISSDSLQQLKVRTTNTTGQFESSATGISIKPLQHPGRLIRERYWEQPDRFILSETEFLQAFPHDEYRNESDPKTWNALSPVWQQSLNTSENGTIGIGNKKLKAGWYVLEASSIDKYNDTVTNKAYFLVMDAEAKSLPTPSYMISNLNKTVAEPGETIVVSLGSDAENLVVIQQKENLSSTDRVLPFASRFELIKLNRGILNFKHIIRPEDLGGMGITQFYVKHNRFYSSDHIIAVPRLDKELEISVQTYRDKTLPGAEEKWKVKISGKKGEKIASELLTSMYDASLDQFAPHQWIRPSIWPTYWNPANWNGGTNFTGVVSSNDVPSLKRMEGEEKVYDELLSFGDNRVIGYLSGKAAGVVVQREASAREESANMDMVVMNKSLDAAAPPVRPKPQGPEVAAQIRKDFKETAFFFPHMEADADGSFSFSFTMPEALTTWKWQLFAHSRDLATGLIQRNIITQKDLMVQPNLPRFLREGDRMEITTKIVNISDKEMTGQAELQLIDAITNQPVDGWFRNFFPNQYFTVAAGSSELVKFPIEVPYLYGKALTWRIIARSGNISDGEEASLPVLTNRQLVTESVPFFVNGSGNKTYELKKLLESAHSESLSNKSLVVEYSSNPAWYAVQALTYLTDYPYECSEQTFNRLYGNLLAAHIVRKMPRIKSVMEKWQTTDTAALLSNLHKNQELKQVLLEETPWVLEAQSETEQKKRIAQLFDLVKLATNRNKLAAKLLEMQSPNGGFSWFKGGPDDRYITQYIVTGIGHLLKLGAVTEDMEELTTVVEKALPYLDARIKEDYDKRDKKAKTVTYLNYYAAQYHYMRSFFPKNGIPGQYMTAANHYRKEIQQNWQKGNRMAKGMIALALHRTGDKQNAQNILKSLEETSIKNEELGMYWKDNTSRYYWQDAPIETQALLIEAFSEIGGNIKTTGLLKAWLLKNKQTNHWQSTKATADACYALLLSGNDWLKAEPKITVSLGDVTTVTSNVAEAGTGYYQKIIPGTAVHPEMGKINVKVQQANNSSDDLPVWGAVYWQYFEDLDKITASASPLKLKKQVMVERLTNSGPVLEPVTEGTTLKVGDKLKIRMEITSDRSMEYVHLKDMRASGLEPINVISGYRWQGGLGYYESTRDASTNFFISYLPKGTHVMEYGLFVSHAGIFSNGISTIQCMYAPEFTSHSEGVRINVE